MEGFIKELEKVPFLGKGGGELLSNLDTFQKQLQSQASPTDNRNECRRIVLDAGSDMELHAQCLWIPEASWPSYADGEFSDQQYDEAYRIFLQEQATIKRMPYMDDDGAILPFGVCVNGAHGGSVAR